MYTCDEINKWQNELRAAIVEFNLTQSFNNLLNVIERLRALSNRISDMCASNPNENKISTEFYHEAITIAQGEFECTSIDSIIEHSIKICELT
ncbi:MAG: hypothetical protein IJ736_05610 [Firmicutes bacterium]|nr:hypothetical protein [Bacillota bacterium]